jgi:hypothetical protein
MTSCLFSRTPLLVHVALVAASVALPVAAQTAAPAKPLTRAEVRQQAASANMAGKIEHGEADHDAGRAPAKPAPSTVKRADVRKEAAAANKAGKIEHGEADHDAGRAPAKPAPSTVKRAEVRKEAREAVKSGQTEQGEMTGPQKTDEGVKPKKP